MKQILQCWLALLLSIQSANAFKFVYIPCDQSSPMDEWHLHPKDKEDEIGCLTSHLQKWYGKAGRLTNEQKKDFKGHLKMHATVR
jgi:hypothetical protein